MPLSQIKAISRIQNTWLWGNYSLLKRNIVTKHEENVQELELFHGSRENDPKLIYERDETKKNPVQINYFTTDASYSDIYSYRNQDGYKEVILFKVIRKSSFNYTALSTEHNVSDSSPSVQLPQSINRAPLEGVNSQVYMIQNPDKTYPAYLIKYA